MIFSLVPYYSLFCSCHQILLFNQRNWVSIIAIRFRFILRFFSWMGFSYVRFFGHSTCLCYCSGFGGFSDYRGIGKESLRWRWKRINDLVAKTGSFCATTGGARTASGTAAASSRWTLSPRRWRCTTSTTATATLASASRMCAGRCWRRHILSRPSACASAVWPHCTVDLQPVSLSQQWLCSVDLNRGPPVDPNGDPRTYAADPLTHRPQLFCCCFHHDPSWYAQRSSFRHYSTLFIVENIRCGGLQKITDSMFSFCMRVCVWRFPAIQRTFERATRGHHRHRVQADGARAARDAGAPRRRPVPRRRFHRRHPRPRPHLGRGSFT